MINLLKKLWRDRRGNALVIAGAALPLVIGSAGFATDTIQWALWTRQMQRAADSSALAGVYGKLAGQTVTSGTCASSTPVSRNQTISNLTTRLGMTPTCSVQSPPTSGAWTAPKFNAVKVTISASRALPFSGLFMTSAPTITTSATAAMVSSGQYCVRALKKFVGTGLIFQGNPTVNLKCGMHTNAQGGSAIDPNGTPSITASPMAAAGQIASQTGFATGTVFQPFSPQQDDPFATQVSGNPVVPSGCNQSVLQGSQNSVTVTGSSSSSPTTVCYKDLKLTSGQSATFTDAIVLVNAGAMQINGGATLNCTRCTFVMTSSDGTNAGTISINGGATVVMTPPTQGTYKDIVIYKDRRTPECNNCNAINGNSSSSITGAIYIPNQEVQFSGNGGMTSNCLQIVGATVTFTGNSSIENTCAATGPHAFDGSLVRLVS
ncbi:MAG: pilus assembly protein TadG-related protein [Sphingomicrobium sp.]